MVLGSEEVCSEMGLETWRAFLFSTEVHPVYYALLLEDRTLVKDEPLGKMSFDSLERMFASA